MPESHEFHEFDELDEVASEYFPSLEERILERGLTCEQALDLALQNLSEYRTLAKKCGLIYWIIWSSSDRDNKTIGQNKRRHQQADTFNRIFARIINIKPCQGRNVHFNLDRALYL